ncbi:SseB family protein [Mucilaginibacter sp. dw_454]|uniref:SseB family protein n=1 Tax=Mucilaginibacter sp. dw_454 TaxID=2720079 RepID=UPI001BD255A7|nr:SseB family protein [Mucilaginibacter sp. dw_454]
MTFWINPKKRKPVDFDTAIENPALKTAFEKYRLYKTEYYGRKVITEIKCANFMALITTDGMSYAQILGKAGLDKDQLVNLVGIQDKADEWFQPLFSDASEIDLNFKDNRDDLRTVVLDINWTINFILGQPSRKGIVINPGSDGWVIYREQMEWYLKNVF